MTGAGLREDPVGLIGQALAMGAEFPGPAEDVLLSWILKLDPEIDPLSDLHGSSGYRRQVAKVLVRRVLARAVADAGGEA